MPKPVLLKSRAALIRHAINSCGRAAKTRRLQKYVLDHFGIQVSQPLVCNTRRQLLTHPEDWKLERQGKWLSMLVREFGPDQLINWIEAMREEEG